MVAAFGNTYGWSVHDMAAVGTATELNVPQRPRRVLVVDDDPDFLQGLRNLLIVEGYEVARAANADQALDRIERFDAQLAIIDYRLGRTVGVDLVRPLQQRRPDLLCVLVTAYSDMDTAVKALRAGFYDYLVKPLNTDVLLSTLERCFDRIELEQKRAAAEAALAEARRYVAVAQIAGGVAHHLNNKLMVLLGCLEELNESFPKDSPETELTTYMFEASQHVRRITQDLIAYSRQQLLRPQSADLNDLAVAVLAELAPEFAATRFVERRLSSGQVV